MKKILARGRVLGSTNSEFAQMLKADGQNRLFTLASGKQACFESRTILSGDIQSKTFVDSDVNGRDQLLLTPESVSDISRTIKLQQFFPAIGRVVGDRIEILDGSRRRYSCMLNNVKFDVLVTAEDIDVQDARQLARDIQTAREHSLRELGKRFELLGKSGLTNEQIARVENVSPAKVSRALQAASVPDELIALFPVINDLSLADYQALLKISEKTRLSNMPLEELAGQVRSELSGSEADKVWDKSAILALIKNFSDKGKEKPGKHVQIEKIREFSGHNRFARKKVDTQKRLVVYEFSRMSPEVQRLIDAAVKRVIDNVPDDSE